MSDGVLVLAHGTPESLDELPEYLTRVRGGRAPSDALVDEMRHNYAAIGGRSPLTDITRAQAEALSSALDGLPVLVGMRHWKPFVADALAEADTLGLTRLVAVPMAPQYSSLSVAKYREAVEAAAPAQQVRFVESWHDHPGLLDAFAERVDAAIASFAPEAVVFTAHSLPLRAIEAGDPYADQVRATATGVARRVGVTDWRLAWQSAGRTPEPWLGPAIDEVLAELAGAGIGRVLVAPVGFVCDHTEVLFDIDVQARGVAECHGATIARPESLNTSATFIAALAAIVRDELE